MKFCVFEAVRGNQMDCLANVIISATGVRMKEKMCSIRDVFPDVPREMNLNHHCIQGQVSALVI